LKIEESERPETTITEVSIKVPPTETGAQTSHANSSVVENLSDQVNGNLKGKVETIEGVEVDQSVSVVRSSGEEVLKNTSDPGSGNGTGNSEATETLETDLTFPEVPTPVEIGLQERKEIIRNFIETKLLGRSSVETLQQLEVEFDQSVVTTSP